MPKAAARFFQRRVGPLRVERLQDITNHDAIAEGCRVDHVAAYLGVPWASLAGPREAFAALWDNLHGRRAGCAWADDPWVAVLGFRPTPRPPYWDERVAEAAEARRRRAGVAGAGIP